MQQIVRVIFYLLLVGLAVSCKSSKSVSQGVKGMVIWFEGDRMPGPDKEPAKGEPVNREIYFYEPTSTSQCEEVEGVFFKNIQTRLVRKVTSSDDGSFGLKLEPGTYSVFVGDPNGLFANRFDGNGIINPVSVFKDEVTEISIRMDYRAAY